MHLQSKYSAAKGFSEYLLNLFIYKLNLSSKALMVKSKLITQLLYDSARVWNTKQYQQAPEKSYHKSVSLSACFKVWDILKCGR